VGDHLEETVLQTAARQQMQFPVVFDRYEGMDRPPWGDSPPRALSGWARGAGRRMDHVLENEDVDAVRPLFDKPDREE
jgi:hypothetical protein